MNTTPDFNFIPPLYQTQKTAFKIGQKKMLEKVLEIVKQWEIGKYSNEEFRKVLNDYYVEFYGQPTTKN